MLHTNLTKDDLTKLEPMMLDCDKLICAVPEKVQPITTEDEVLFCRAELGGDIQIIQVDMADVKEIGRNAKKEGSNYYITGEHTDGKFWYYVYDFITVNQH